jgi:hypothetical protein
VLVERGDVAELDLNPVSLSDKGVLALDARILLRCECNTP